MDRIKEVQNEPIRAAKQEERVMTKQFEISKRLAEWLGLKVVDVSEPQYQNTEPMVVVQAGECRKEIFNPFANTVDGRAQLAECLLKMLATQTKKSNDELILEMLFNIHMDITALPSEPRSYIDAKAAILALDAVIKDLEFRADMKRGDEKGIVDVGQGVYMQALKALGRLS